MALLWLEMVNSLHQHYVDDGDFTAEVLLGFGAKILRKPHIRVAWGEGSLVEGEGELEAPQGLIVEGWVFDADGNDRVSAYVELAALLRKVVAGVYAWAGQTDTDITINIQNHEDALAPNYGFQITVNASTQVSIPLDDAGDCDIIKALTT